MFKSTIVFGVIVPLVIGLLAAVLQRTISNFPSVATGAILSVPVAYVGVRGLPEFPPLMGTEWLIFAVLLLLVYPITETIVKHRFRFLPRTVFAVVVLSLLLLPVSAPDSRTVLLLAVFLLTAGILWWVLERVSWTNPEPTSLVMLVTAGGSAVIMGYSATFLIGQLGVAFTWSLFPFLLWSAWTGRVLSSELVGVFVLMTAAFGFFNVLFTSLSLLPILMLLLSPYSVLLVIGITPWRSYRVPEIFSVMLTILFLAGSLIVIEPSMVGLGMDTTQKSDESYRPYNQ